MLCIKSLVHVLLSWCVLLPQMVMWRFLLEWRVSSHWDVGSVRYLGKKQKMTLMLAADSSVGMSIYAS